MAGILWRVLGADGARWASPEAWSIVADACEAQGFDAHAVRVRRGVAGMQSWTSLPEPWSPVVAWYMGAAWTDELANDRPQHLRDTDGALIRVDEGAFMKPVHVTRRELVRQGVRHA